MPNMLIRNVDERLHAQLVAHAKADGQSLQQYLLARLEAFAETMTAREAIERWEAGLRGSPSLNSPLAADAEEVRGCVIELERLAARVN
jgi:plasmid stability protein